MVLCGVNFQRIHGTGFLPWRPTLPDKPTAHEIPDRRYHRVQDSGTGYTNRPSRTRDSRCFAQAAEVRIRRFQGPYHFLEIQRPSLCCAWLRHFGLVLIVWRYVPQVRKASKGTITRGPITPH